MKDDLGTTSLFSLPTPCATHIYLFLRVRGTVPPSLSGPLILKGNLKERRQCDSTVLTTTVVLGTSIHFPCVPSPLCILDAPLPSATTCVCFAGLLGDITDSYPCMIWAPSHPVVLRLSCSACPFRVTMGAGSTKKCSHMFLPAPIVQEQPCILLMVKVN